VELSRADVPEVAYEVEHESRYGIKYKGIKRIQGYDLVTYSCIDPDNGELETFSIREYK
jgi:hypothetical protein